MSKNEPVPDTEADWRTHYLTMLQETGHNRAALLFLDEWSETVATLFENAQMIEMLIAYVIPRVPQDFLRYSGPASWLAKKLEPATLMRLRVDAIRELDFDEMVRELAALSIWENEQHEAILMFHVELIIGTIAALPTQTTSLLRKHLHDELVLADTPRGAIERVVRVVILAREKAHVNQLALNKLMTAINRAAAQRNLLPYSAEGWHQLIAKRLRASAA